MTNKKCCEWQVCCENCKEIKQIPCPESKPGCLVFHCESKCKNPNCPCHQNKPQEVGLPKECNCPAKYDLSIKHNVDCPRVVVEPKEEVAEYLYCDKDCKCVCHQKDYPLPEDFNSKIIVIKEEVADWDWIKEFDKEFSFKVIPQELGDEKYARIMEKMYWLPIKSFITKTIAQEREKWKEELIEWCEQPINIRNNKHDKIWAEGYTKFRDNIINKIKNI